MEPDRPLDEMHLDLDLQFRLTLHHHGSHEERLVPAEHGHVGKRLLVRAESAVDPEIESYPWREHRNGLITELGREAEVVFGGGAAIEATIVERQATPDTPNARARAVLEFPVSEPDVAGLAAISASHWTAARPVRHSTRRCGPPFSNARTRFRSDLIASFSIAYSSGTNTAICAQPRGRSADALNSAASAPISCSNTSPKPFLLTHCGVYIDHRGYGHRYDHPDDGGRHGYSREDMDLYHLLQRPRGLWRAVAAVIRFGAWAAIDHEDSAKHWARIFKRVVLGFVNAYRAVTGLDPPPPPLMRNSV